jgi:ATP-binding cassette subfamily F protein 3
LGASLKLGYFAQAHTFGQGANAAPTEFTRFGYIVGDPGDPAAGAAGGNGAGTAKVDEGTKSVLDALLDYRHMTLGEARSYLGQYLFRGEDVYKRLDMLSGGERGRLALALLALNDANLLLLDEPTNHLDIPTQEVLQRTLENFQGTILLVSHDRYLIDRLATQIWELREGRLHVFTGTLAEHNEARRIAAERQKATREMERRETRRDGVDERQQRAADRKRQEATTQMEVRVHGLEEELARIARELDDASQRQDVAAVTRLGFAWQEKQQQLERALEEWAALAS